MASAAVPGRYVWDREVDQTDLYPPVSTVQQGRRASRTVLRLKMNVVTNCIVSPVYNSHPDEDKSCSS